MSNAGFERVLFLDDRPRLTGTERHTELQRRARIHVHTGRTVEATLSERSRSAQMAVAPHECQTVARMTVDPFARGDVLVGGEFPISKRGAR